MPRVPQYDGPQIREQARQGGYLQPVDVGRTTRQVGAALGEVSDVMAARQRRADQDAAFSAEAKLKAEWLDYDSKLREQRRGAAAATYDADVETWWKDAAQRYGADLSPGARQLVSRSLTSSQLQAMAGAKAYKEQQLTASAEGSYRAAQGMSINEAANIGTEEAAQKALADIRAKSAERAAAMGWTPEQVQAERMAWASSLHGVVLQRMMRADPAAAQVYYDKNKSEIGADQQTQIEAHLAQTSAALDANNAATEIWGTLGPKRDGQPVELDKLEAAARERYKGDPTRIKSTIDELRQRAGAFNAAEQERTAGNTNAVMDAYSKGTPLARLQTMPEFLALPGGQRSQILEHINDRNHTLWARSVEDRARLEREQARKAFPAFLDYSNPDTLAGMTRAQVQALLPSLGQDLTSHLVQKWDGLQKPAARLEAKIDKQDFDHVADQLGLSPYKANSEDKKRQLGELQYKIETLIDSEQRAGKRPLTREEKMNLMRREMTNTVVVDPTFGFAREVPLIQLQQGDLPDVVVPDTDRAQIAEALRTMYARTKSSMYEPTEKNMRAMYLAFKAGKTSPMLPEEK